MGSSSRHHPLGPCKYGGVPMRNRLHAKLQFTVVFSGMTGVKIWPTRHCARRQPKNPPAARPAPSRDLRRWLRVPNAAQPHARAIERPSTELNRARAQAAFLEEFAEGGIVLRAAQKAGVGRRTVYLWLAEDPEFQRLYDEAIEDAMDRLESAARKRAEFGVERPVFQHGVEVGTVTDYSDNLMMFLLKGRRPEVFKDAPRSSSA